MLEQIHGAKESLWITRINPIKNQSVTAVLSSWSTKLWTPLRGEASPWSWAVTGGKWTLRAQGCNKWFPKAMNPRAVTQRSCPALSLALCSASAGPAQHPCPALTWATHRTQRSPTPGHWFLSLGARIFGSWIYLPAHRVSPALPAGFLCLPWCLSGFPPSWLSFIEGWDIKSYEQRVLWRTWSCLEGPAVLSVSSVFYWKQMSLWSTIHPSGAGRNLRITVCCSCITLSFLGLFKSSNSQHWSSVVLTHW